MKLTNLLKKAEHYYFHNVGEKLSSYNSASKLLDIVQNSTKQNKSTNISHIEENEITGAFAIKVTSLITSLLNHVSSMKLQGLSPSK